MAQQPEQAPRPADLDELQVRQSARKNRPSLVPPSARRRQAAATQGMRTPTAAPLGAEFTLGRPGRQNHVPRAFQYARSGGSSRAGASHGGTTVAAQYSVDYIDDLWFNDPANGGWVMLDSTSENGLQLMNAVVSNARQTQRPLYYDTDDATGNVVNVYLV